MRLVDLAGEKKFGEKWSMKSSLERECSEIANSLKILKQMDPKLRSRVTVLRYEVTNWSYYGFPYSKKNTGKIKSWKSSKPRDGVCLKKSVPGSARLHKNVTKVGSRLRLVTQKRNRGRFPLL